MNSLETIKNNPLLSDELKMPPGIPLSQGEKRVLKLFDGADAEDWEDWRWQLRNRIRTKEVLKRIISLTPEEEQGIDQVGEKLTMAIPPYFASLMDAANPGCPVRLQCVPRLAEMITSPEELVDPCGEEKYSPVHGLVHRYPDRVLFLVSETCAMYCRYCTRSRMVGEGGHTLNTATYDAAFDYIRSHKEIRDVLISGGDPLTLGNNMLEYILRNIKAISHVEFIRIGTRVPISLPQRITPDLISLLKKYAPIWISIHSNHPLEITPRVQYACQQLADNGFPLGSQSVLLKGVNDDARVMKGLMHELIKNRVRPYYIYQCDPIIGSRHFRTSVTTGVEIIEQMRGFTSGYAVPTYVVDAPGGGGKIPISPDYIVSHVGNKYVLRNYDGEHYDYFDV